MNEGTLLTRCALHCDPTLAQDAQKCVVKTVEDAHPIHKAKASVGVHSAHTGFVEAEVDVSDCELNCPCFRHKEEGMLCVHTKALSLQLSADGRGEEWCDE